MKKKFILLVALFVMFIPTIILADGGSPEYAPYEAFVSNKDGASLYYYDYDSDEYKKSSIKLKFNDQVRITYENQVTDDITYGRIIYSVNNKNNNDEDEEDDDYFINLAYVSPIKEVYTLDDLKKAFTEDEEEDFIYGYMDDVLDENKVILAEDTYLRKGPSFKYEKLDNPIKKEVVVNKKAEVGRWIYIESEEASGWVDNNNDVVMEKTRASLWLLEDIETYLTPYLTKKTDVVIHKNEKFGEVYRYDHYEANEDDTTDIRSYRVVYNDNIYYINLEEKLHAFSVENDHDKKIVLPLDTDGYDEIDGKVIGEVPENTIVEVKYHAENEELLPSNKNEEHKNEWLYIEYNGKGYWVSENGRINNYFKFGTYSEYELITIDDIDGSDYIKDDSVITIPANTILKKYYESDGTYYYIEYKNKWYWVSLYDGYGYNMNYNGEETEYGEYEPEKELVLYNKPNGEKTGETIPENVTVELMFEYIDEKDEKDWEDDVYWYYVKYKDKEGWITEKEADVAEVKEESIKRKEASEGKTTDYKDRISKKDKEPDVVKPTKKLSTKDKMVLYTSLSIIFALFIFIFIYAYNNKKKLKNKKEEVKVEEPIKEEKVEDEPTEETIDTETQEDKEDKKE